MNIQTRKIEEGKEFKREDLLELKNIDAIVESYGIPAEGEYKDYFFEIDEKYVVTIIGKLKGEKPNIEKEVLTGIVSAGEKVQIRITASITEGKIETIEAINGAVLKEDISETEKIFEVSENGIYYFKTVADNKRSNVIDVEIGNIKERPRITVYDETKSGFTISVENEYTEGLVKEYKYYVGGELKSSGTTENKYIVTGLSCSTEYTNIYVEVYFEEGKLTSEVATARTSIVTIDMLETGEYIKYDSGSKGIITCRVLYPKSSSYGLQIVSNKNVTNFAANGSGDVKTAQNYYNNIIATLNSFANQYLNTTYALDVRCVGSNPANKNAENKGPVAIGQGGSSYLNIKGTDSNWTYDYNVMKDNNLFNGQSMVLASREIYYESGLWYHCLRLANHPQYKRHVLSSTYNNGLGGQTSYSLNYGFRPCIKLKDTLKITGGNGESEAMAYTIGL